MNNRVIIVTGASSGIGAGCVHELLNSNDTLIGFDVQPNNISHDNYTHFIVDVRDEDSIIKAVEKVTETSGKIDALINCAGVFSHRKPFYKLEAHEWEKVISVNLTGTFLCSKHVSLHMIKRTYGKIVNISCIRSKIFRTDMAEYAASKGGVTALTSAMALDLAPFNIQVNSIIPGQTYTGMTEKLFADPKIKEYTERNIPLSRIAQPVDIARTPLRYFLISDASNYITGQTIVVDGGFTIAK